MIAFSIMPLPEMVSLSVEAEIQLTRITAIISVSVYLSTI